MSGPEGGCDCGKVRYRLNDKPFVVHCCHCGACQRQSGTAFGLNALIETERVEVLGEAPERHDLATPSGMGQIMLRCPGCKVAVWSHYGGAGEKAAFIRVGTLDNPDACPPDVHIFTESKQAWVVLPDGAKTFPQFYRGSDIVAICGEDGAARFKALRT